MNINDDIFVRGFEHEKGYTLPFWVDDNAPIPLNAASDCLIVRIKLGQMSWIIIIFETSNAIKTTAIGFDTVSNGQNGTLDGYILHHSVPKPQKNRQRV